MSFSHENIQSEIEQRLEPTSNYLKFKIEFGNQKTRLTWLTSVAFFVILGYSSLNYISINILGMEMDFSSFDEFTRIFTYIATMIPLWILFLIIFGIAYHEKSDLGSIGLKRLRMIDFAWGFASYMVIILVALGVTQVLTILGMPPDGEIAMLLPETLTGKVLWFFVSFTAGFCEESLFRGYLMSRIRIMFKSQGWLIPALVSSLIFGFAHTYQGWHGFIITSVLGLMFALTYIKTKSLWPAIIGHFFIDFLNIFIPQ